MPRLPLDPEAVVAWLAALVIASVDAAVVAIFDGPRWAVAMTALTVFAVVFNTRRPSE